MWMARRLKRCLLPMMDRARWVASSAALSDDVDLERLRLSSELRRAVDAVCVHEPATNEVPLIAPATVILLSMRHEGQP